jgi:hypothetical protein
MSMQIEEIGMSAVYGPYVEMGKIAQQMAAHFQKDPNLAMEPLLAHFMDEVKVNIAADTFDHAGFMKRLQVPLQNAADATDNSRRKEFLQALVDALRERMDQEETPTATGSNS